MSSEHVFYVVVTAIVCGCAALVAPWLAYFWYAARRAEQEAVLKKSMLDRGMSPDEIVKVVTAGRPPAVESDRGLTNMMIVSGHDADAIAAVTAALDECPAATREDVRRKAVQMAAGGYDGGDIAKFVRSRAAAVARRVPESAYPA